MLARDEGRESTMTCTKSSVFIDPDTKMSYFVRLHEMFNFHNYAYPKNA